jgi:hypothetical protein
MNDTGEKMESNNAEPTRRARATKEQVAERNRFIRDLRLSDNPQLSDATIVSKLVERFNLTEANARAFLRNNSGEHFSALSANIGGLSVEDLTEEEEALQQQQVALQQQLQELQAKKRLLVEAKTLKIEPSGEGVLLKKAGNVLPLTFPEAQELLTRLTDYLSEHGPATEVRP